MPAGTEIHFEPDLIDLCQRTTVVTASERLARALHRGVARNNVARGRTAWRTPNIHSLGDFLRDGYDRLREADATARELLDDHAQRLVWLELVPPRCEIDPDRLYDEVTDAWRICHDWHLIERLDAFVENESQRLFRDWSRRFRRAAEQNRWVTTAELPRLLSEANPDCWTRPDSLTMVGFDVIPPSLTAIVESLRSHGVAVTFYRATANHHATAQRIVSCEDPEQEFSDALAWAREVILADASASVAIVAPDVVARYDQIVRQLDAELQPAAREPNPLRAPYDVSGGVALARVPVVATGLELLEWLIAPLHFERAEAVLSSPLLELDSIPSDARQPRLPEYYDAATFARRCASVRLGRLSDRARRLRFAPLQEWLELFSALLVDAGWPNLGSLTSENFQAYQRFQGLLDTLGRYPTSGARLRYVDALAQLHGAVGRELFAPRRPSASLQVLGYLESAHLAFSHLWVCGLSDTSWPSAPRPNPFVPTTLQRGAGVPRVDAPGEVAFARRLTAWWRGAAAEVTFSYPRNAGDAVVRSSPLITVADTGVEHLPGRGTRHPQLERSGATLAVRDDDRGRPIDPNVPGHRGSSILRDQAACPFRAYARWRLNLVDSRPPHTLADAADRGTLLHDVLHHYYDACLARGDDAGNIEVAVRAALARHPDWPRPFRTNEQQRLTRLLAQWLDYERGRLPGRVAAVEQPVRLALGALQFDLRIDRINALDEPGGRIVIDYKTGDLDPRAMFGSRPREPQLAMYALCWPDVRAIACAQIAENGCRITGCKSADCHDAASLEPPSAHGANDWQDLRDAWRRELERLADEFALGTATVAPRDTAACRECNLHPVCRIRSVREFADS
jgi:ATP-dependent helicase/nuclease subunit B